MAKLFMEHHPIFSGHEIAFVFGVALGIGVLAAVLLRPWELSDRRGPMLVPVVIALVLIVGIVVNEQHSANDKGHTAGTQPRPEASAAEPSH